MGWIKLQQLMRTSQVSIADNNVQLELSSNFSNFIPLTYILAYGKFISFKQFREIINSIEYRDKIELSHRIIEEGLRVAKTLFGNVNPAIGFSGGKDSLVTLDLVLHHIPKDEIYVVYSNTLIQYRGTREYVIKTVKEFFKIRNLIEIVPKITPWELWKKFGFPKSSRDRYYTPVCCVVLKELPLKVVIEKYGINIDFNGIRAEESLSRFRSLADNGLIRRTKYIGREVTLRRAIIRVAPLGIWKKDEIFRYIEERKLPINPAYRIFDRVGCAVCTNNKTWEKSLSKINEKIYKFIKNKINEWGIQNNRIRINKLKESLKISNPEELYIIRFI